MKNLINKIKKSFGKDNNAPDKSEVEDEYIPLDTGSDSPLQRVIIRPFELNEFADVKPILDFIRQDFTIALVNIKPLKEKDMVELKQSINNHSYSSQVEYNPRMQQNF